MPRLTPQTVAVLRALLAEPTKPRYGRDLGQELRLKSGTLQPLLARLEQAGIVRSWWETPTAHEDEGRPRRRYYQVTDDGAERARQAIAEATKTHGPTTVRHRLQPGY
jgi:PadR family transcriptional regulator PadR